MLVSLPGCLYCERIRREHLTPMRRESGSGVVQIDLGSARTLVDFDGMTRSHDAVAPATRASRRPCCRSDRMAMNFAERLVGAGLPDFYGAYLEQRLAAARQALARAH